MPGDTAAVRERPRSPRRHRLHLADGRPLRPTPLQRWRATHVDGPAAAVVAGMRRRGVFVRCQDCDGTGRDPEGRCWICGGQCEVEVTAGDPRWRAELDRRLRAAGLDPKCFDDNGKVVAHAG